MVQTWVAEENKDLKSKGETVEITPEQFLAIAAELAVLTVQNEVIKQIDLDSLSSRISGL